MWIHMILCRLKHCYVWNLPPHHFAYLYYYCNLNLKLYHYIHSNCFLSYLYNAWHIIYRHKYCGILISFVHFAHPNKETNYVLNSKYSKPTGGCMFATLSNVRWLADNKGDMKSAASSWSQLPAQEKAAIQEECSDYDKQRSAEVDPAKVIKEKLESLHKIVS